MLDVAPSPERQRLDSLVVERGLAETGARAQAIIQGGGISVDGVVVTRPGERVRSDARIEPVSQPLPYVSRGGLKLAHAIDQFGISVAGRVCIDVGASTGGFTDVLLQRGAAHVYAIDVGYGQLAWSLRNDPRVTVMERTNIRTVRTLPELGQIGVIDVSFISVRQVLPHVTALLVPGGEVIALIKPQFEAGREQVGKKGVVRSVRVWIDVLSAVAGWAVDHSLAVKGLARSPVRGPAGNVEFLMYLALPPASGSIDLTSVIASVVDDSQPSSRD